MRTLVRTNATLVWLVLTALTVVSWALGTEHGVSGHHVPASLAIIAVGIFKIRLVGLHFMELRMAPLALRGIFEAYCAMLFGLLTGMFLFA
jgi:hypothetical protein